MHKEQQVALYVRVSREEQVDGFSLEAQEAALRAEAKLRNKLVYNVYSDGGVSGVREDREGLDALLRDARRGCFGEVLVWTISRLGRKLGYLLEVFADLQGLGVVVRSLNEAFDMSTPVGNFALTMLGAVAQMQREAWMEASRIGMERRAKSGRWGGGMMLGYRMVADEEDLRGGGKLEIIAEEAETVREIFTLYAAGLGYKAIANRLNGENKTGKTGKAFTLNTVKGILTNAAYVGKTRFGEVYYDGLHEPIISKELWEAVQLRLQEQSRPVHKTIAHEYLLSGLLKCPACGSGMLPSHTKSKRKDGSYRINHYYACGAYLNKGSTICKPNSVRAIEADAKVMSWLQEFLTSPFWLRRVTEVIRQQYEQAVLPQIEQREQAERKLTELGRQSKELLRRYEEGFLDKPAFLTAMGELAAERKSWQAVLVESVPMAEQPDCWSEEDIRVSFRVFQKVLSQAKPEQRLKLIRQLAHKIYVNKERQVVSIDLQLPSTLATEQGEGLPLRVAI